MEPEFGSEKIPVLFARGRNLIECISAFSPGPHSAACRGTRLGLRSADWRGGKSACDGWRVGGRRWGVQRRVMAAPGAAFPAHLSILELPVGRGAGSIHTALFSWP